MAFGSVSLNIAQLAEAVYLGIVGTEALAAMGFAFPVTITLFAFAGGIGTGASSVIARAIGSGNQDQAARLVTHAQILTLLIGVALGLLGGLYAEDIAAGKRKQGDGDGEGKAHGGQGFGADNAQIDRLGQLGDIQRHRAERHE